MKRILVPTDFSKEAGYALDAAANISSKTGAQILLMHVVEGFVHGSFSTQGGTPDDLSEEVFMKKLLEKGKSDLEKLVTNRNLEGVSISTAVKVGNPFHHIARDILDNEADLVIIGSKGASGYEEVLIGSNTERVVRHSNCPVITVKEPIDFTQVTDIVFAADFIDTEDNVANHLKNLQNVLDAKLHLVKVDTPSNFESSREIKNRIHTFVRSFLHAVYNPPPG